MSLLYCDIEFLECLNKAQSGLMDDDAYHDMEAPVEVQAPSEAPLDVPNMSEFEPFAVQASIVNLPRTPLSLLQEFIPVSLIKSWVEYTNKHEGFTPVGPTQPYARTVKWKATTTAEVYLFLGILIYMEIHIENRMEDYWKASPEVGMRPKHPIVRHMTHNRFFLLYRRISLYDHELNPRTTLPTPFHQIDAWSNVIQRASLCLLHPGTNVAFDECIVGFTGWNDNALVLMLTTVYTKEQSEQRLRRRPTSTTGRSRPIRLVYGDDPVRNYLCRPSQPSITFILVLSISVIN